MFSYTDTISYASITNYLYKLDKKKKIREGIQN